MYHFQPTSQTHTVLPQGNPTAPDTQITVKNYREFAPIKLLEQFIEKETGYKRTTFTQPGFCGASSPRGPRDIGHWVAIRFQLGALAKERSPFAKKFRRYYSAGLLYFFDRLRQANIFATFYYDQQNDVDVIMVNVESLYEDFATLLTLPDLGEYRVLPIPRWCYGEFTPDTPTLTGGTDSTASAASAASAANAANAANPPAPQEQAAEQAKEQDEEDDEWYVAAITTTDKQTFDRLAATYTPPASTEGTGYANSVTTSPALSALINQLNLRAPFFSGEGRKVIDTLVLRAKIEPLHAHNGRVGLHIQNESIRTDVQHPYAILWYGAGRGAGNKRQLPDFIVAQLPYLGVVARRANEFELLVYAADNPGLLRED